VTANHQNDTNAGRPGPWDAQRRVRGPECVSDLTLDRLAQGEVTEGERTALVAHLAGCADCARASAALTAEREQFGREAPIANLAADALARASASAAQSWMPILLRRFFAPLAMLGAAFAFTMWWSPRSATRTKGGFSLAPYVMHPESAGTGSLHGGEPLHPGDRLQFRYDGARGGYLTVVAVDSAGQVSVYYPPGPTAAPVAAGHDVPLSSAVELDGALGNEVIVGARCDTPVAVADVVAAARNAVARALARGAAATELGPLGLSCVETRYQIAKRPRPTP